MDRKPANRKDDFKKTQQNKLQNVIRLAREIERHSTFGASAITIAGDLFHQPKGSLISRKLDVWLTQILQTSPVPVLTIPGNHDMAHDSLISFENHPYVLLRESKTIRDVCWPGYAIVGNDPPVIVIGQQYMPDGPVEWLEMLRRTRAVWTLRSEVEQKTGKKPLVLALTHCHWGDQDGILENAHAWSINHLLGTGIDVSHYGDPHRFDGTKTIDDQGRPVSLVGPGALTRGTLAEHDVNRAPMVSVMSFLNDGTYEIIYVKVPHRPAEEVLDVVRHHRKKSEKEQVNCFVEALQNVNSDATDVYDVLDSLQVEPKILSKTKYYITQSKASLEDAA